MPDIIKNKNLQPNRTNKKKKDSSQQTTSVGKNKLIASDVRSNKFRLDGRDNTPKRYPVTTGGPVDPFTNAFSQLGITENDTDYGAIGRITTDIGGRMYDRGVNFGDDVFGGLNTSIGNLNQSMQFINSGEWENDPIIMEVVHQLYGEDYDPEQVTADILSSMQTEVDLATQARIGASARMGDTSVRSLPVYDENPDLERYLRLAGYDSAAEYFGKNMGAEQQRGKIDPIPGDYTPQQKRQMAAGMYVDESLAGMSGGATTYNDLHQLHEVYTLDNVQNDLAMVIAHVSGNLTEADAAEYQAAADRINAYAGYDVAARMAESVADLPASSGNRARSDALLGGEVYSDVIGMYEGETAYLADRYNRSQIDSGINPYAEGLDGYEAWSEYLRSAQLQQSKEERLQRDIEDWQRDVAHYRQLVNEPDFAEMSQPIAPTYYPSQGGYMTFDENDPYDLGTRNPYGGVYDLVMAGDDPEKIAQVEARLENAPMSFDFNKNGIQYMTDQERAIFYYLYNKNPENPQEAIQYLEDISWNTQRLRQEDMIAAQQEYALEHPFKASLASVPQSIANEFMGAGNAIAGLFGYNPHEYDSTFDFGVKATTSRATVGDMIAENAPDWEIFDQNVFKIGYDALMSAADSAANAVAFGGGASVMMGLGAFNTAYQQNLASGAEPVDAFVDAMVEGAIETGTEYFSIDALISDPSSALGYFLKNVITEGTEEMTAAGLNMTWDVLKNGVESQINQQINNLLAMGYDPKEASRIVWTGWLNEVAVSGVTGMLSGGAGSSFGAINTAITDRGTGRNIIANDNLNGLLDIADTVYDSLPPDVQRMVDSMRAEQAVRDRLAASTEIDTTEATDSEQTAEAAVEAVEEQQTEVEQEAAPAEEQVVEAEQAVEEQTTEEQAVEETVSEQLDRTSQETSEILARESDAESARLAEESDRAWLEYLQQMKGQQQTEGQEQTQETEAEIQQQEEQDTQEAVEEAVSTEQLDQVRETEQAESTEDAALAEAQSTEVQSRQSSDKVPKVSAAKVGRVFREVMRQLDADAQGVMIDNLGRYVQQMLVENGYTGDRTNLRVLSNKILRLNAGQQLSELELADIQKSPAAVAVVNDLTARVDDYNATQLKKIGLEAMAQPQAKNAKPVTGKAAQRYLSEQGSEYTPAEATTMQRNYHEGQDAVAYAAQFRTAYEYGQEGRNLDVVKGYEGLSTLNDAQIGIAYELGRAARNSAQQIAPRSVGMRAGNVDTTAIRGMQLNAAQHASVNFLSKLAKTAGFNVRFVATSANAKGQFTEENGSYNKATRTITIDVNAGRLSTDSFNYAMVHTAGHELTHFIKDFGDANLYKAYQEFVFGHLSGKMTEAELNRRIDQTIAANKKLNKELSREEAIDEVVADASADVLSKMTEQDMQQLAEQNPSLLKRIKNFIQRWVKSMKALLKTAVSGQQTSNELAKQMEDVIDEQYAKWMEMFKNAAENARKADAEAATDAVGIEVSESGDTAYVESPEVLYSLRSLNESDYITERDKAAKALAKRMEVSVEEASRYIDNMSSIAALVASDTDRLDFEPEREYDALKKNSEYKWTVDFSTLCKKRLLYTGTFDAIQRELGNTPLNEDDYIRLRQMMADHGYEVACAFCYVESRRKQNGEIIQKFLDVYTEAQNGNGNMTLGPTNRRKQFKVEAGFTPTIADFNTSTGFTNILHNHRDVYDAYMYFMNARGTSKPKLIESRTDYRNEILKRFKSASSVRSMNKRGGLRVQSFSDFEVVNLLDMMQVVTDMARVGLMSQAYTKVPDFARVFGSSGMKINLSLVTKGVDKNGNLIFDDVEGMPHKDAFEIRDMYPENVGTILVGKDDATIKAAMADPRIDYIIPFHRSGWTNANEKALGIAGYTDFTKGQNEVSIATGRTLKNIMPSEYWDYSKTGDENAEIYKAKCKEMGRIPKFPDYQNYPGYWKLLIDFRMYDNDGNGAPQQPVRPDINMEEAQRVMNAYEGGHQNLPVARDVVKEFLEDYRARQKEQPEDVQYSARDFEQAHDSLNQTRDPSQITDREILANAMDTMATTPAELDWVQRYRNYIGKLNEQQQQMDEINADIVRMTNEDPKGNRDEIIRQKNRAKILASQIDRYDKRLLEFEAGKPLKAVVQRERTKLTEQYRERAARQIAARKETAKQREAQQRERYNEILSEMRTKHKAEMSALRSEKNQKISELRSEKNAKIEALKREKTAAVKEVREEKNESFARQKYLERVQKDAATLREWLKHPTNKAHVPQFLRQPLGEFMESLDFSSQSMLKGKGETKADERMIAAMRDLHVALSKGHSMSAAEFGGYVDLTGNFLDQFNELTNEIEHAMRGETKQLEELKTKLAIARGSERDAIKAQIEAYGNPTATPIMNMDSNQLRALSDMIRTLNTSIRKMNATLGNAYAATISGLSGSTIAYSEKVGDRKDSFKAISGADDFLSWKNVVPVYVFKRFGTGGEIIFKGLQDGQDKLARNADDAIEYAKSTYNPDEVQAWESEVHTFTLNGRTVRVTTAQLMSLYCLNRRDQGRQHLLGGGVRVGEFENKGKTVSDANDHMLLDQTLDMMLSKLTKRQIEVAQNLQKYMTTVCAEWGNEISMKRFGYEMFTEDMYFPIEVDKNNLKKINEEQTTESSMFRLLNLSATKPLNEQANNAVVLRSIFDVFADHTSDMAKYNALALPILDMIKWYNYAERLNSEGDPYDPETDGGKPYQVRSVQKSLESAFGAISKRYVESFLRDLNGERDGGREDRMVSKMLSNYKIAAVGANLRVGLLQITSLPRAAYMINGKYIVKGIARWNAQLGKPSTIARKEIGIAKWKSLGFYDTNISRNVREKIKNDQGVMDKAREYSMKLAEWGDAWTMGVLYGAVEAELKDTTNLVPGSEAYNRRLNERMRDIVYGTQVVDSVMTRSHMMRSKGLASMFTSFMSEPTIAMNMLGDSIFEARMQSRAGENFKPTIFKKFSKAAGIWFAVNAFSAVVEALFSAMRDDDEFETFAEKYFDALIGDYSDAESFGDMWSAFWGSAFGGNLNPFDSIPILKDLISAYNDEDNTPMWLAALGDLGKGVRSLVSVIRGGGSPAEIYGAIYSFVGGLSKVSGLPGSNAMRDIVSVYNSIFPKWMGWRRVQTYDNTESQAANAIFNAIIAGDDATAQYYYGRAELYGMDTDKIGNKMVKLAEEAYTDGTITRQAADQIMTQYGGRSDRQVDTALEHADYERETGLDYNDMQEDYIAGALTESQVREYLREYEGLRDDEIDERIGHWDYAKATGLTYSNMKEDFLDGVLDADDVIAYRVQYGGIDEGDAETTLGHWEYERDTGLNWNDMRLDYEDGVISEAQLREYLATYGGKSEEQIEETVSNYDYYVATGYTTTAPKYWRIAYAHDSGGNVRAYIDEAFDTIMYGGAETRSRSQARSSIASSLKSYYAKQYLPIANTAEGRTMLEHILDLYEMIGYNRAEQRRYIEENWFTT